MTFLGCYGDLLDLEMRSISIETDFTIINDLLAEAGPEAEGAIEQISKFLSQPSSEELVIDLSAEGGIHFADHIFALMIIVDTDEDIEECEEYSYRLMAYAQRENVIPDFMDLDLPVTSLERSAYP